MMLLAAIRRAIRFLGGIVAIGPMFVAVVVIVFVESIRAAGGIGHHSREQTHLDQQAESDDDDGTHADDFQTWFQPRPAGNPFIP